MIMKVTKIATIFFWVVAILNIIIGISNHNMSEICGWTSAIMWSISTFIIMKNE